MKPKGSQRYILKLYDKPLLSFRFVEGLLGLTKVVVDWCDEGSAHLLPTGLLLERELTGEQVYRWLSARLIPRGRENATRILWELGVAVHDVQGLVDICGGLSLNDSYWIAEEGCEDRFDDVNLYDNDFSEALGRFAMFGQRGPGLLDPRSPELTTGGSLPKAWRIVDGKRVLFKGASARSSSDAGEQLSEFFAFQIARRMGLDVVEYDLADWDGALCSTCELFNTKDLSYVPMFDAFKWDTYSDSLVAVWRCLGADAFESLASMLVFDSVIINTDRHLANFGVLRDNATGRFVRLAPVFDNGRSLFFDIGDDGCDQHNLDMTVRCSGPKWSTMSFNSVVKGLMGERQRNQLARLVGFKLEQHPGHRVSRRRLDALNDFLQRRVEALLAMSCIEREQMMVEIAEHGDVRLPNGETEPCQVTE